MLKRELSKIWICRWWSAKNRGWKKTCDCQDLPRSKYILLCIVRYRKCFRAAFELLVFSWAQDDGSSRKLFHFLSLFSSISIKILGQSYPHWFGGRTTLWSQSLAHYFYDQNLCSIFSGGCIRFLMRLLELSYIYFIKKMC